MVENGTIVYRDLYNQQGKSIVTRAGYGVQIVWKLDPKSGIKEITNVNVGGDLFMLAEMPRKVSADTWVARAATKGEGDVSYRVMVDGCKECGEEVLTEENSLRDPSLPYLRMP